MVWPPPLLPTDKTQDSLTREDQGGDHATQHNEVNGAVNELVARVAGQASRTADIDVGPDPTREWFGTIVDATVAATSSVIGLEVAPTAPGKSDDEPPMDLVDVWLAGVDDGSFDVRVTGLTGSLFGAFTLSYLVLGG